MGFKVLQQAGVSLDSWSSRQCHHQPRVRLIKISYLKTSPEKPLSVKKRELSNFEVTLQILQRKVIGLNDMIKTLYFDISIECLTLKFFSTILLLMFSSSSIRSCRKSTCSLKIALYRRKEKCFVFYKRSRLCSKYLFCCASHRSNESAL